MRVFRIISSGSAVAATTALMLSACGGGGTTPSTATATATPAAQSISFSAPSSPMVGGGSVTLSGTSSSALPVTYVSNTTSTCTVSGTTLTIVADGQCTLVASQAGNASYSAATPVTISFMINGQAQTITFAAPTPPAVGATITLVATASSSLPVSFTASPSSICSLSGNVLTAVAAGACTITASQAGNSQYAAATSVPQTVTIANAVATPTPVVFSSGFTATANQGGLGGATLDGGGFGGYSGSDLDGYSCSPGVLATNAGGSNEYCAGQAFAGTGPATSSAYYFYQSSVPPSAEYIGLFIQAPGVTAISTTADTAGVQLTNQTSMSFTFNPNPEWLAQTNHNAIVLLTLGKLYSGNCHIKLQSVFTPTSANPTLYTIPLSSFIVGQNCAIGSLTPTSVAAALAASGGGPLVQVDFQGDGGGAAITPPTTTQASSANFTNPVNGVYPTTVNVTGAITFQ